MAHNGNEGSMISSATANNYRRDYENSNAFAANNDVKAILFGKNHLNTLLNQTGAKGLRIYYGKDGTADTDPPKMVIVAYDENGDDITTNILDEGLPCPHDCTK